ncbi:hypothetical protein [Phenylobacterium sp.]|uniref:hypothetical protein n=1 Tax=Phenylobacterium sp. TaxID=1871053 RepID=UPI0035AD9F4B
MTRQIDFAGKSGTIYRYTQLDEARPLPPAGANYVLADVADRVVILFAGETDNLAKGDWRSPLVEARERYDRVEVLTRLNVRSAVRVQEQEDIIRQHQPEMNAPLESPPADEPEAPPAAGPDED